MTMTTPAILTSRLRSNGHCPPSLLTTEGNAIDSNDVFFQKVSSMVQDGVQLRETVSPDEFRDCVQLAGGDAVTNITDPSLKEKTLVQRRAVILAIIGATPSDSPALKGILNDGLLFSIKTWLDEILNLGLGGVDLLLHLLGSIALLPVTKEMVTSSKLGKQVAAVEKNKICAGSLNENAIKERVTKVKEEWSASVKRMKKIIASSSSPPTKSLKRSHLSDPISSAGAKKSKPNEQPKKSSLSSYLTKVSRMPEKEESAAEKARKRAEEQQAKMRDRLGIGLQNPPDQPVSTPAPSLTLSPPTAPVTPGEKQKKNVKWADSEGGPLYLTRHLEDPQKEERKKRERNREKEYIQKARKSNLVDKNDSLDTMVMMYSSRWQQPKLLPPDSEIPPIQVDSKEMNAQMRRVLSSLPASFLSEEDVPSNPTPLSEVEQALEMASHASAVPAKIPFFAAEPEPVPATLVPPPVPAATLPPPANFALPPAPPPAPPSFATAEVVQQLGLPPFLVGQNTQALQTIAASPGLLTTFVDMNGNYDQGRVLTLVQTLTSSIPGAVPPPAISVPPPPPPQQFPTIPPPTTNPPTMTYGQPYGGGQTQSYQAPPPPQATTMYSAPGSFQNSSNSTEGNLHLSGYGPMTTQEAIIQLFSPYVKVDEVVPKNGFMFLNTSDPEGAKRAKEALTGVMVGGGPLRINPAVRRNKNQYGSSSDASGHRSHHISAPAAPLPRDALGQIDYNAVRDDRGNGASRNLFVAGYGPGTTEQQLRDAFSPYCRVTGIVMKSSFSFVNTAEKESAVNAREALTGTNVNGGSLRINFAKESGRLGTSFDSGMQQRSHVPQQQNSYYGRSY